MPFYTFHRPCTTSGSPNTLATHFRITTVAGQNPFRLMALYAHGKNATAGGGTLRFVSAATAGSGGTTIAAPNGIGKRIPDARAADTGITTDATAITPGTGNITVHCGLGWAQTGGQGGWVAPDPESAPRLLAGGGANGNGEVGSFAPSTSQSLEIFGEFSEV